MSSAMSAGERIARCLPGASFELEALVRLVGIEETESVPTAAVTCGGRARLLVNPSFVAEHCTTDEHLFLLVMHEMWHVLLGHTTLYERPTLAHNIAFDALINAGLARQHPQPEFRGFLEGLNSTDSFPSLLLRPPAGWPLKPDYGCVGPRGTAGIMRRLYPPRGSEPIEPTYDELLALLGPEPLPEDSPVVLIGDHRDDSEIGNPLDDPLLGDVVRRIVGKWPPPPRSLAGRDAGRSLERAWFERRPNPAALRAEFVGIVKRALAPHREGAVERRRVMQPMVVGPGPLPNTADRLLPARQRLLGPLALPNQVIAAPQQHCEQPQRALVYVDVSGSMNELLPHLIDLLLPLARQGLVVLRQFSNTVTPLCVHDLASGEVRTTGGTDIACVLEDAVTRPERRIVLLTDGYVGRPTPALLAPLVERGTEIITVLPDNGWADDLAAVSTVYRLPGLEAS